MHNVCRNVYATAYRGGQRTDSFLELIPSTFMWGPEIKHRSSGPQGKDIYLLSHLADLLKVFLKCRVGYVEMINIPL